MTRSEVLKLIYTTLPDAGKITDVTTALPGRVFLEWEDVMYRIDCDKLSVSVDVGYTPTVDAGLKAQRLEAILKGGITPTARHGLQLPVSAVASALSGLPSEGGHEVGDEIAVTSRTNREVRVKMTFCLAEDGERNEWGTTFYMWILTGYELLL